MFSKVLLVGCGAMGAALYTKWRENSSYDIRIIDPSFPGAYPCLQDLPLNFLPSFIVFAVKPKTLATILTHYHKFFNNSCVFISIAAGISLDRLHTLLPKGALVVRTMPNLPVIVECGITALTTRSPLTPLQKDSVSHLFDSVGSTIWVEDDTQMNIITALSGSGPAYFFYLVEALIKAGITQGLPKEIAENLVKKTFIGAAILAEKSVLSCKELQQKVTSPNGTTQAAISLLDQENSFNSLINNAVKAAILRAQEINIL